MILPGRLKKAFNDIHWFKASAHLDVPERAVKEQAILADLGQSSMFDALLDHFEGEIRTQFRVFVDTDDEAVAVASWRDARASQRFLRRLMDAVSAKQRGEELEALAKRQMDLMKADQERFRAAIERSPMRGSTPSHE